MFRQKQNIKDGNVKINKQKGVGKVTLYIRVMNDI